MKKKIVDKFSELPSVLLLLIAVLFYGFTFISHNIIYKIISLFIYIVIYSIVSKILTNRDMELSSLKRRLELNERIEEIEKSRNR